MGFKVGDVAFDRGGQPGFVAQKNPETGEFLVSKDKAELKQQHRHGYVNGLEQQDRNNYLTTLDELKNIKDPREKIDQLNAKITELKLDPSQHKLVGYLEAELFHVMNINGIHPKTYSVST